MARAVGGVATEVTVKIWHWCGKISFMALPLGDFDIILGHDFLVVERMMVMPIARVANQEQKTIGPRYRHNGRLGQGRTRVDFGNAS